MNPSDQARQIGVVDSWLSQVFGFGGAVNPGNNTNISDTGALAAGYYDVTWSVHANCVLGAANLDAQLRNADNTADIIRISFLAAVELSFGQTWLGVKVAAGERFRVYVTTGFTGTVSGAIIAVRRA